MGEGGTACLRIDLAAPRALFAELLAGALDQTLPAPTPVAIAYLVDLLDARVRAASPGPCAFETPQTLLAGRLAAPHGTSTARLLELRRLGDAALFVAGFFAESLGREPFGPVPTCEAGRRAYAALSAALARVARERTWTWLYEELADRFCDYADLLAEVGDRTRGGSPPRAAAYSRFLATGSPRERRRLIALGVLAPEVRGLLYPQ
jgi:hypothetical protein